MAKFIKWYVNINHWKPTKDQWLALASSVPDEELVRIEKFCYKEDSKSSLIGQVLIRKFLSIVIKEPTNEIELVRSNLGRPEVAKGYQNNLVKKDRWPRVIDFNVSHSGDYCVFVGLWSHDHLSPRLSVGVDVTKIVNKKTKQELDRFLDLMSRREFTPREWENVTKAQDDRQKCVNFTRLWCLKESYIKAIGLGLQFDLHRIEFQTEDSYLYNISTNYKCVNMQKTTKVLLDGKLARDWKFLEAALDVDHLVAVGIKQHNNTDGFELDLDCGPFEELTIEPLMEGLLPIRELSDQNWIGFHQKQTKDHVSS